MNILIGFLFTLFIIALIVYFIRKGNKKTNTRRFIDIAYEKHNLHPLLQFSIKGINKQKGNKPGYYEDVELIASINNRYDPYAIEVKINNRISGYTPAGNSYLHNFIMINHNGTLKALCAIIDNGYDIENNKSYLYGRVALTKDDSKIIDSDKVIFN